MPFRCERHGKDFDTKEKLQDHIVRTHSLPKNPNAENYKRILDKTAKSKHGIIWRARGGLKK